MDKTIRVINKGCVPGNNVDIESSIDTDNHTFISRGKAFIGEGKRIRIALEGQFGREIGELCEKLVEPV